MLVRDWDKSERGPQRRKTSAGRLLHCCCICLNCEPWSASWSYYASMKEEDDGVPLPKFCSDACKAKAGPQCSNITEGMKAAARALEWRDPEPAYRNATEREKYNYAAREQQSARSNPIK